MKNPLIWADIPDPDVIYAKGWYYMTSTTMHMTPGVPVMRSKDLLHWEIISYVYTILEDNDGHSLKNGKNIYGSGSWASSLRYHNDMFYICFACNDTQKTYIYKTDTIENGKWHRTVFEELYHDPSLVFDNKRAFIIYGAGSIKAVELSSDASSILPDTKPVEIIRMGNPDDFVPGEGSHVYKINGWYYIFIIQWPRKSYGPDKSDGRRIQWCFRSRNLLKNYEGKIVLDDDLGYNNNGVAQGGIFQLPDGRWFSMLFQDHDAVGRIPVLIPVEWKNDWPVFGTNGKVPIKMDNPLPPVSVENNLLKSDNFDTPKLGPQWQWNHNPENELWSLSERPGFLRLRTGNIVPDILHAPNTLTQRTFGPVSEGEILIDSAGMNPGDFAGIAAFQNAYGFIAVHVNKTGNRSIILCFNSGNGTPIHSSSVPVKQNTIYLKVLCNFTNSIDTAQFAYSLDGVDWKTFPDTLKMKYTLDHFMGYRFALFNYATEITNGYADFDYFHTNVF